MISNFLFHRVNPHREKLWDPMDVPLFEKCIKYISHNYEVQLMEDVVKNPGIFANKKTATIVFDDGYKDNITYAAPVLNKYKCKASFYVVTQCINTNTPTWTYILEYLFQQTQVNNISLTLNFLPEQLRVSQLSGSNNRIAYVKKLKPCLKKLTHEQRTQVLNIIINTYTDVELPAIMMNWNDLMQLKNDGHYIGSHTATHPMLGTMQNTNDILFELRQSATDIEKNLGHFPKTISYPVGSYNQTTIALSRQVGYESGLAVNQIMYDPSKHNLFEIPRIELYNEHWLKTKLRITGSLQKIKSTIGYAS